MLIGLRCFVVGLGLLVWVALFGLGCCWLDWCFVLVLFVVLGLVFVVCICRLRLLGVWFVCWVWKFWLVGCFVCVFCMLVILCVGGWCVLLFYWYLVFCIITRVGLSFLLLVVVCGCLGCLFVCVGLGLGGLCFNGCLMLGWVIAGVGWVGVGFCVLWYFGWFLSWYLGWCLLLFVFEFGFGVLGWWFAVCGLLLCFVLFMVYWFVVLLFWFIGLGFVLLFCFNCVGVLFGV